MTNPVPTAEASDEQLAQATRHADPVAARGAVDELYRRYGRRVLAFLAARLPRSDVDDVHQEVWLRVWRSLPEGFRGGSFPAWVFTIARHLIVDRVRGSRPGFVESTDEMADRSENGPLDILVEDERKRLLARCLERLAKQNARAADLVRGRLAGDGYETLANQLGLTVERTHRLFFDVKEQLKRCVGADGS
jgi:RNA polymerase sigma-70 factor (ECF subfamily)